MIVPPPRAAARRGADRRGAGAAAPPPSRACRRPTGSSGTSRTRRRGRRTAAASPPAAAPIRSTASAISSCSAPAGGAMLVPNQYLHGFGLAYDGGERFDSITPVLHGGIVVARGCSRRRTRNYLRYFDTFTNTDARGRVVSTSPGAAPPARSKTADRWPSRPRRTAIGTSISPMRSSR